MLKNLISLGIVGFAGYQIGKWTMKKRPGAPIEEVGVRPLGRIARDARALCRDLDPLLAYIEQAYADGRISPGEVAGILTRIEALI